MADNNETSIVKSPSGKKLIITRSFDASVEKVWQAWTESEQLDKWWAPKPWQTQTKKMDFTEGGKWLYAMIGPQGEKHWCRVDFKVIKNLRSITATDGFCNEDGVFSGDFPIMDWHITFAEATPKTEMVIEIACDNENDLDKIVEMGFKEGFTMALGNLDEVLN